MIIENKLNFVPKIMCHCVAFRANILSYLFNRELHMKLIKSLWTGKLVFIRNLAFYTAYLGPFR